MDDSDLEKISGLLMEIMDENDNERRVFLADSILAIDPDNPVAKYIKWQSSDDDEETIHNVSLLEEAVATLRPMVERLDRFDDLQASVYSMYVNMLSDLASFYYLTGKRDQAYEVASEFMELDEDCEVVGRVIYYATLIERGDFEEVLEAADQDNCETPPGEHCKAIAAFEMEGISENAAFNLLNAFSLDADLAFYITGIWDLDDAILDEDEEEASDVEETMMTTSILSELWNASDERLAFLTAFAFAFGYITGRIGDSGEAEMIEGKFRENGYIEELEEARDVIQAKLASGTNRQEIDEEALTAIREADYLGLLDE
ncbi:MAG: hypothetical protein LBG12_02975 [Synergistaceae bacterium]|jgi:hypothetical protein|nr:hypothetical protein [Synergistaceae bacterium]